VGSANPLDEKLGKGWVDADWVEADWVDARAALLRRSDFGALALCAGRAALTAELALAA
jgi:hypothetical protein